MSNPRLDLVAANGDRIPLADYGSSTDDGIYVLSGVTGFGMPGVQTSWLEGAGAGATYRGSRTLSRDVDLPLVVQSPSDLQWQVDRLVLALLDPFDLEWTHGWETWILKDCVRIGGGNIVYGKDTIGEDDLFTVITIRAGQPYWVRDSSQSMPLIPGTNTITNEGTAPSPPVWLIEGPCQRFVAISPQGRKIAWTGTLLEGQSITIDTGAGTAMTGSGVNAYSGLDTAPKFWHLPHGTFDIDIQFVGSGSASVTWTPRNGMVI